MIRRLLHSLVSLMIPPSCSLCDAVIVSSAVGPLCANCRSDLNLFAGFGSLIPEGPLDALYALGSYEGLLKEAVCRLKFQKRLEVAHWIPTLLEGRGLKPIAPGIGYDEMIPVPLHRNRARERGYNQAAILARAMGQWMCIPVRYDLLERARAGSPQVGLSVRERRDAVKGVFAVPKGCRPAVDDRSFLLVDDVFTTGATLNECARILKRAGAKRVDGFVMARTL